MKLLCVSDVVTPELYESYRELPFKGTQLILACGDLPPEYLSFLRHALDVPLYYVRGNHDIRYSEKPPVGCTNLHGRIARFKGLTLMGLEGSRWYNGGPYQYTEQEMKKIIRRMRFSLWRNKGVDIVISHAPPQQIHDGQDLCHQGFESFRTLIDKYQPAYFIHGHIHRFFENTQDRMTKVEATKVINTYGYTIIDIKAQKIV